MSSDGGAYPRWSRDGKELFYLAADGRLTTVPVGVTGGPNAAPDLGTPKPLFDAPFVGGASSPTIGFFQQYDVAPDGQRFLVNLDTGNADTPITVVVNWPATLTK